MTGDPSPFMLLRARPRPGAEERFDAWFRAVHLEDVRRIPGISAVHSARTPGGTRLGFYAFADADSVQTALQSPQAAYARGTWEQWAPHLEELAIEIWATLFPMPMYRALN